MITTGVTLITRKVLPSTVFVTLVENERSLHLLNHMTLYSNVSQPPGRGPVPGSGINYTGPREIHLELITDLNVILYLSTCHTVHIVVLKLFMIMP